MLLFPALPAPCFTAKTFYQFYQTVFINMRSRVISHHNDRQSNFDPFSFAAVIWLKQFLYMHRQRACPSSTKFPLLQLPLKQAADDAVITDIDFLCCRHLRQAGHRHDITCQHDYEACAGRDPAVLIVMVKPLGRPSNVGSSENEYWVLAIQIGRLP